MSYLTKRSFLYVFSIFVLSIGVIGGCSSNDPDKSRIEGVVLSVNGNPVAVGDILVSAINSNGTRVSSRGQTNASGAYSIGINNESGSKVRLVTLIFTTQDGLIFSEDFLVPRNTTSLLNVTLANGEVNIADGDYTVLSKPVNANGNQTYIFADAIGIDTPGQASFVIDGNTNTCVRARDNSTIIINVDDFLASNCNIGVRSGSNANISINADDDFEILSGSFGVRSANASVVNLSALDEFFITSANAFGIGAINSSTVNVNNGLANPDTCEIVGLQGDIEVLDLAQVNVPPNCN